MDKDNNKSVCIDRQKGVSLIITFFVMIIILAVVLSISVILYSEVKVIRNIGNSMASLYAADSGIEKVLFYDRQVLPILSTSNSCTYDDDCTSPYVCQNSVCTKFEKRGLCFMFDPTDNPNFCDEDDNEGNNTIEHSGFCHVIEVTPTDSPNNVGCNRDNCTNCKISFETTFDDRKYTTTAIVSPNINLISSDLQIDSKGVFPKGVIGGAGRQIRVSINLLNPGEGESGNISFDTVNWTANAGNLADNWYINSGVLNQSNAIHDPMIFYYTDYMAPGPRTVKAKVFFSNVGQGNDGRVGISLLNNGNTGFELVYSESYGGLIFLHDSVAWGLDSSSMSPNSGESWWFEAEYNGSGTFHGKAWQVGSSEPGWQVIDSSLSTYLDNSYIYSGVVGESGGGVATGDTWAQFGDFIINP